MIFSISFLYLPIFLYSHQNFLLIIYLTIYPSFDLKGLFDVPGVDKEWGYRQQQKEPQPLLLHPGPGKNLFPMHPHVRLLVG